MNRPLPLLMDRLELEGLPVGKISKIRVRMVHIGTSDPVRVPVMVAVGREPGPVLGITAAVHGDELNGLPIIHRLFRELDIDRLSGTVVAVPVVNVPGFLNNSRTMAEGFDLNRLFPGKPRGTEGEVYAWRFVKHILERLDILVDLHTASFGRINSLYVRADLSHPVTRQMAMLQNPQIIVHNPGSDGTLRAAAMARGIPAITVEVGDPLRFQSGLIGVSLAGVRNLLVHLEMQPGEIAPAAQPPVICGRSYWLYTDVGGILEVFPPVAAMVHKEQLVARVSTMFGDAVQLYEAPEEGIVVGKSSNPVANTGARILHLGIPGGI